MKSNIVFSAVSTLLLATGANQALAADSDTGDNPYSPAHHHPYRHGVVPTITVRAAMLRWQKEHPQASNPKALAYGGGNVDYLGINGGISKVYLVFWGSQWGTSSTNANGNLQFSADAAGAAVAAQQFFKGLGTGGEKWSAGLTQWCGGAGVSYADTICPATGASYIPYQQRVQVGVWYDNAAPAPAAATETQLDGETVSAAKHFGYDSYAPNSYYVILSPPGTNPDNYKGNFCAWHGYVSQPQDGGFSFSNQPYNLDQGAECGQNFVNSGSAGLLDGFTISLGQQWQAAMTDMQPGLGWTNPHTTGQYAGEEGSQECEWIAPGSPGGAANVKFDTGTFAEQSSWSNDTHDCAMTHPIAFHNLPPTANFAKAVNSANPSRMHFTDQSTDVDGTIVSRKWNFYDMSSSTLINPGHTYVDKCLYPVTETVTDDHGLTNTATQYVGPLGTDDQICDSSFEIPSWAEGSASRWEAEPESILCTAGGCAGETARTGQGFALLNGSGQWLLTGLPYHQGATKATLTYWLHIDTQEATTTEKLDKLEVQVRDGHGKYVKTLQVFSNLEARPGYYRFNNDITGLVNVQPPYNNSLNFIYTHSDGSSLSTNFVVDDVTVSFE